MLPHVGAEGASLAVGLTSLAAVAGRLGVAGVIDRLDQRRVAASGIALQVAGEALMLGLPGSPAALYLGCVGFGLSVGNNITLPSVIIQREFPAASFGLLVGLAAASMQVFSAFAPTLMGVAHDLSGGYTLPLAGCAVLEAAAAAMLMGWRGKS
jgi:cyanate permease